MREFLVNSDSLCREKLKPRKTLTHTTTKKHTESGIEKRRKKVRTKEELGFKGAPKSLLL